MPELPQHVPRSRSGLSLSSPALHSSLLTETYICKAPALITCQDVPLAPSSLSLTQTYRSPTVTGADQVCMPSI